MNNKQPSKDSFFEIFKADFKIALTIIGRTIAVLIMFSIAVALGYGIPNFFIPYFSQKGLSSNFLYGGAALGKGIALTTFKSLTETIPVVGTYISSGSMEKLSVFFVKAFIAVLGFYFAFFSIKPIVKPDDSLMTFFITFSEDSSMFIDVYR